MTLRGGARSTGYDDELMREMPTLADPGRFTSEQLWENLSYFLHAVVPVAEEALGIGATTAIFSLVEGVLLRPLPFRDPQRLVLLGDRLGDGLQLGVTDAEVATYEHGARAFSSMGAYMTTSWELSGGPFPESVNGARLAGVFPTLGIAPVLGRVFTRQEDDAHAVTVISYALWLNRFHRDPHVAGTTITLDRRITPSLLHRFTVIASAA